MYNLLSEIGVPIVLQTYLSRSFTEHESGHLIFRYGSNEERFSKDYHQIPVSSSLWVGGNYDTVLTKQLIVAHSAMEGIAFLALNLHRFDNLDTVKIIATGYVPSFDQAHFVREFFPYCKITLLFGNDLFGSLGDIVFAAGIHRIPVAFAIDESGKIRVGFRCKDYDFTQCTIGLNFFERQVKMRFGLRTFKVKNRVSFLEELKASI
jgi:hypothetical protein